MPVLKNPKWERFAQELAKGKTATEAYVLAGYKPNDGNAATLKGNQRISDRVSELLERGAIRAELTVKDLIERLLRIADKAEALEDSPGLSVSRQSTMDLARLHGWIREKHEHSGPNGGAIKHDLSGIPDDKLAVLEAILGSNPHARRGAGGDTEPAGEA